LGTGGQASAPDLSRRQVKALAKMKAPSLRPREGSLQVKTASQNCVSKASIAVALRPHCFEKTDSNKVSQRFALRHELQTKQRFGERHSDSKEIADAVFLFAPHIA
jgi:hypothetical protein